MQILQAEGDQHRVFDKLVEATRDLGFDQCAYGLRSPLPLSRQRIVMINNYPVRWQARYAQQNYLRVDPTVQHALRSQLPVLWRDDLDLPVKARGISGKTHAGMDCDSVGHCPAATSMARSV